MANKISVIIDVAVDKANTALTGFRKSVGEADGAVGKFKAGAASASDSLKANIMPVAAAAGAAMVAFAAKSVQAASDLSESTNAVNVSFGNAAEGVLEFGEDAAESMGLSKSAFNEAAVGFAAFAENIAGPGGDVAGVIGDITTRASDFASVMNLDVSEAANVFRSALSGETEPIKKFGIDLSAAAVEAFALASGMVKSKDEMTEAIKVQARYGLLMDRTNKFAGDFANTSDGLANSSRIAAARFEDLQASIGTKLLPVVEDATGLLLGLADAIDAVGQNSIVQFGSDLGLFNNVFGVTKDLWDKGPGSLIAMAAATDDAAESVHDLRTSMVAQSIESAFIERRTRDLTLAVEAAEQAEKDREDQIRDNIDALKDIADAQDEARQATEDARMATLESLDASLGYRNQIARTAEALANVATVTGDAKSSAEDIAQAHRDAEGAALAQASAAVGLADAQAEMEGRTLTAGEQMAVYRGELSKLKDSASGDVAIAIQMMIDEIDRMRSDVDSDGIGTDIGAGIAAGIWGQSGAIGAALRGAIDAGKRTIIREYQIQSPSRLFAEEVGAPIAEGIAEGITEDGDKISKALSKAIEGATKDAIDAADQLVDDAMDAWSNTWKSIDGWRDLEDMQDGVTEAQLKLDEVMADPESTAKEKADALERLQDAHLKLAKATVDDLAMAGPIRDAWIANAAQAGLTASEINGLVASFDALVVAQDEATASTAAINAEATKAQKVRTDFDAFVASGLISKDQLNHLSGLDAGAQVWTMQQYMDAIVANFPKFHSGGVVPGARGAEVPIMAQAGETVVPAGSGMGGTTFNVTIMADPNPDVTVRKLREFVRRNGPIQGIT